MYRREKMERDNYKKSEYLIDYKIYHTNESCVNKT